MICDDISDFAAALPRHGALAGLDLGTRTIGIAVSDGFRAVATPLHTIKRKKFTIDAEALVAVLLGRHISGVVLGLPRNMDGSEGPRSQATRAFAKNLSALTELPIVLWDERFSTAAAKRTLLAVDASRAQQKATVDALAAQFFLQGWVDAGAPAGDGL